MSSQAKDLQSPAHNIMKQNGEVSWDEVENAQIDSQFESLSDIQISLLLVEMLEFYSYLLTFCKTGAYAVLLNNIC